MSKPDPALHNGQTIAVLAGTPAATPVRSGRSSTRRSGARRLVMISGRRMEPAADYAAELRATGTGEALVDERVGLLTVMARAS